MQPKLNLGLPVTQLSGSWTDFGIWTSREIVAFTNGEKLDGIEKAREEGKRNYQKVLAVLLSAGATLLILWIVSLIFPL